MLKRFKQWIIKKTFERYYGNFIYPFEKSDEVRSKLPQPAQYRYLLDVNNWMESKAYSTELEGIIRKFYQLLALKPVDDIEKTAYRLVLIFIQNYESRMLSLQNEYKMTDQAMKTNKLLKQ